MPAVHGLNSRTDTGALTINGVDMHTPAWNVLDCRVLWLAQDMRIENVTLPEPLEGDYPFAYKPASARHSLEMAITGFVNSSGVPYSNPWVGLETNIEYLRANLDTPPVAPIATFSASLVMPSGATRTAQVQVASLTIVDFANVETAALLEIVIPSGRFA